MNTTKQTETDDLRPEYDLNSLRVRKVGAKRKQLMTENIQLEADVAEIFPDSKAVNEALRFLIRITQESKMDLPIHP